MPAKKKQAVKKAVVKKTPGRKAPTSGRKTVSKDTSGMVASAPATAAAGAPCGENCITTQDQAIKYMHAEVLWATLFVEAWTNPTTFKELQDNQDNANAYLEAQAVKRGLPVKVPPGVTLKIVFDTADTVHLIMPAPQNIPSRPVDMVPHAL